MEMVDMHEAKTSLSRHIGHAAAGDPRVIAKPGRPLVKGVPTDAPRSGAERRLGFLAGEAEVPDDFDTMGADDIERMFRDDS